MKQAIYLKVCCFFLLGSIDSFGQQVYRINNNSNDAYQIWYSTISSQLILGKFPFNNVQRLSIVGVRFEGIDIELGGIIDSAFIQFTCEGINNLNMPIAITGERSTHPELISEGWSWNISSRTRTGASVYWPMSGACTEEYRGPLVRTPNLGNIVQELVNQDEWQAGNPMLFIFEPTTDTINRTMHFYDYMDGVPEYVAELTIYVNPVFTTGGIQEGFNAFLAPNPSRFAQIRWRQFQGGTVNWNVYDSAGRLLSQSEQYFQSGPCEIDLMDRSEWPAGIYIIELFDAFHLPVYLKWIKI